MAEIGMILLLLEMGLETDVKRLARTGFREIVKQPRTVLGRLRVWSGRWPGHWYPGILSRDVAKDIFVIHIAGSFCCGVPEVRPTGCFQQYGFSGSRWMLLQGEAGDLKPRFHVP